MLYHPDVGQECLTHQSWYNICLLGVDHEL